VTRRRTAALLAVGALVAALAIALCWPMPWLVVRHGATLAYAFPGAEGTRFALRWMHSVEEEDWIEEFTVIDSHIRVVATRFKTFGAGVPAAAGSATTLEDGWVVMRGIDRVVDPLAVQAAAAEHYRMRYGSRWLSLSPDGGQPILTFAVVCAPAWRMIGGLLRGRQLVP